MTEERNGAEGAEKERKKVGLQMLKRPLLDRMSAAVRPWNLESSRKRRAPGFLNHYRVSGWIVSSASFLFMESRIGFENRGTEVLCAERFARDRLYRLYQPVPPVPKEAG